MSLRFLSITLPALLCVLILTACGGDATLNNTATVEKDLRLSSIDTNLGSLSPVFSAENLGPYELDLPAGTTSVEIVLGSPAATGGVRMELIHSYADRDRDPQTELISVNANSTVTRDLEDGDNLIIVRVIDTDSDQFLDYRLVLDVVGSIAILRDPLLPFNPNFDYVTPADFVEEAASTPAEYIATVPFELCTLSVVPQATLNDAVLRLNGATVAQSSANFIDLQPGVEELVVVEVESESGSTTSTYNFRITREASDTATQAELDANTSLSSLSVSSGSLTPDFQCGLRNYALRLDRDAPQDIEFTAAPTVAGRTMQLGEVDPDNVAQLLDSSTLALPVGQSVSIAGPALGETKTIGISLNTDTLTTPIVNYSFTVTRAETNLVEVSSAIELQSALDSANPGDEIVLTESISGTVGAGTLFSANASGLSDQPIILRGNSSDQSAGLVSLGSGDLSSDLILELSGDNWELRDLQFSNASQALRLNVASNNSLENLVFQDLGVRGLELSGGSSNNQLLSLSFSDIGSIASAGQDEGEALVIGTDSAEANTQNTISNSAFGPGVSGELVDIKAGSTGNLIRLSSFDSSGISGVAEYPAAVVLKGSGNELAYSTFSHDSAASLSSAVFVIDPADSGAGENNRLLQNEILVSSTSTFFVDADSSVSSVSVDGNFDSAGNSAQNQGSAVQEVSLAQAYTIEWLDDDDQSWCLAFEEISDTSATSLDAITPQACDNSASQQWQLSHQGDNEVLLGNVGSATDILAPLGGSRFISPGTVSDVVVGRVASAGNEVSSSRWLVTYFADREVNIQNAVSSSFYVTVQQRTEFPDQTQGVGVVAFGTGEGTSQRFALNPVD